MKKVCSLLILAMLGWILFRAFIALPSPSERKAFGVASRHIRRHAVEDTGAVNLVAAVLFDYRALDTLGEVTVIFSAAASVALLFSSQRKPPAISEGLSPIVKRSIAALTPFMFLVGFYIVLHGHISPGGGFQGGVVWGSLLILLGIAYGSLPAEKVVTRTAKTAMECLGALGFVGLACLGLFTGEWLFSNVAAGYPRGTPGTIVSAGAIPLLSIAVGVKIGAGLSAIFYCMVNEEEEGSDGI